LLGGLQDRRCGGFDAYDNNNTAEYNSISPGEREEGMKALSSTFHFLEQRRKEGKEGKMPPIPSLARLNFPLFPSALSFFKFVFFKSRLIALLLPVCAEKENSNLHRNPIG